MRWALGVVALLASAGSCCATDALRLHARFRQLSGAPAARDRRQGRTGISGGQHGGQQGSGTVARWPEGTGSAPRVPQVAAAISNQEEKPSGAAFDGNCPRGPFRLDEDALKKDVTAGQVYATREDLQALAKKKPPQAGSHYVFITGQAYTGTTALYGLVSTSPSTSNLCKAAQTCCEGGPLLMHRGLVPKPEVNNSQYPQDWNAAIALYRQYWDVSKPVLVEKTVANADRFPRLWEALRKAGARASFVYLVRSACATSKQYVQAGLDYDTTWRAFAPRELKTAKALREAGARVHIVRYEEMVSDPYGSARGLLAFLPELGSLDPAKTGLKNAPYIKGHRGGSIMDYLRYNNFNIMFEAPLKSKQPIPKKKRRTGEEIEWMRELGYTKEWFSKFWPLPDRRFWPVGDA